MNNFLDVVQKRMDKVDDIGLADKEIKDIKRLLGFDFENNPMPTYESIEEMSKRLRANLRNANLEGADKVRANELLQALQKDLDNVCT